MSKSKTLLGPTGVVMDFTLIHVYDNSHGWKKDQLLAGEKLKQRVYAQGYADIGWVFLAFVVTTLGQLVLELLCYLLLCAGQAAQQASVAAGDVSTPVDEDGEEPAEAHNPTFPQLLALIFQQLKNYILVELLEAVAGRVLGKYMGFRLDQWLRWCFEENSAPCVPALPRWCLGLGAGVATGTGGPAGLAPPGAAAEPGAVGPVSVVVPGSGGPGPGGGRPVSVVVAGSGGPWPGVVLPPA